MDPNLQILVVDDYNTMVRIVRKLLKQVGYENVDEASNGQMALGMIKEKKYGLIISDWNMEPMTGDGEDTVYSRDSGIQAGQCRRRQEGRRERISRQAVQRARAQGKNR